LYIQTKDPMEAKIQKWGNSLGLRIPKAFAAEVGVGPGSSVDLSVHEGDLVVRPRRPEVLRLADLLAAVTPQNLHTKVSTGHAAGREIW
jgi:antitoxin MazE